MKLKRRKAKSKVIGAFGDSESGTSTPTSPSPENLHTYNHPTANPRKARSLLSLHIPQDNLQNGSIPNGIGPSGPPSGGSYTSGTDTNTPNTAGYKADFSEAEESVYFEPATCHQPHEGKEMIKRLVNLDVDALHAKLFASDDPWYNNFLLGRNTEEIKLGPWEDDGNCKSRTSTYTVNLLFPPIGYKVSYVTEIVRSIEHKPGTMYSYDIENTNAGIPYADSFYNLIHTCLIKEGPNQTMMFACLKVNYKKSTWGFAKTLIEKTSNNEIGALYGDIKKQMDVLEQGGGDGAVSQSPKKSLAPQAPPRRGNTPVSSTPAPVSISAQPASRAIPTSAPADSSLLGSLLSVQGFTLLSLVVLILINILMYSRLNALQAQVITQPTNIPPQPEMHLPHVQDVCEDYKLLLRRQDSVYLDELREWRILNKGISEMVKNIETYTAAMSKHFTQTEQNS